MWLREIRAVTERRRQATFEGDLFAQPDPSVTRVALPESSHRLTWPQYHPSARSRNKLRGPRKDWGPIQQGPNPKAALVNFSGGSTFLEEAERNHNETGLGRAVNIFGGADLHESAFIEHPRSCPAMDKASP